jgi:hypothetical protein
MGQERIKWGEKINKEKEKMGEIEKRGYREIQRV